MFILVLKYSWTHWGTVEYSKSVSMDYSTFGVFMSLSCLAFILVIRLSAAVFDYDCRHSKALISIDSKASSNTDVLSILVGILSIIIYAFISNFVFYRVLLMILHGIVAGCFCFYLPYYNFYVNFFKSLPFVFISCSCFITLIGYSVDSAFFCVLGLVLLNPFFIYLWYFTLRFRLSKIRPDKINEAKSVWELELCIRDRLINYNPDQSQTLLENFNTAFLDRSFHKTKSLLLWEVSYCFYDLKNERVGLVKLCRESKIKTSLEENYQEYIIKGEIKKVAFEKYKEYKIIKKLYKIEKIKKIDKKVCLKGYKFHKYLMSSDTSLKILETSGKKFRKLLKELEKKYSKLFLKYQDSFILIDLYSSFVSLFYGDTEKSSSILSKKEMIEKLKISNESQDLSNINDQNPLMIVSAGVSDFGKIIYRNKQFAELIQSNQTDINKRLFTDFFPTTIKCLSLESFKKFKSNLISTTTYIEDDLFILSSKGYLIEASITIILLGFYKKLFLVSVKKLDIPREACLIRKKKILYLTEGLEDLLYAKEMPNYNIESILNIRLNDLKIKESIQVDIKLKKVLVTYNKIEILNEKVKVLYFYLTKEDFEQSIVTNSIKAKRVNKKVDFGDTEGINIESLFENKPKNLYFKDPINTSEMKANSPSITLNSNNPLKSIHQHVQQSIRAINYFKKILVISVMHKQIIIILLSSCGLLVYSALEIQSIISQNTINILGQTLYSITNLADIAATIQITILVEPSLVLNYISKYEQMETLLSQVISNYTNFNSNWSGCQDSYVLFQDTIPTLEVKNSVKVITYKNMYDFLSEYLVTVKYI